MRKFFAEAVAGMIPGKMRRNRWRGILRYGLRRYLRLKREMKRGDLPDPRHYLAVCAIAKDEAPYLEEWLEWHKKMGVEKFYFYDNGSTDTTRRVLAPYVDDGTVELIDFPGYRRQIAAYDDCMTRHRLDTRWLAFIDIDEFIVPDRSGTVAGLLRGFEGSTAVEVNWLVYGSNGHDRKSDEPVMARFTRHAPSAHPLNRMVKSIVDPRKTVCMTGCHESAALRGHAVDTHGNPVARNFREREPLHDIMRINHYAVKSRQEFSEKQARGRASGRKRNVPDSYFDQYDRNEVGG